MNSPQYRQARAFELKDGLSWQKGKHRFSFGMDYEHMKTKVAPWGYCDPGCDYVFAPEQIEGLGLGAATQSFLFPNLPTQVTTTQDLLNLPVLNLGQSIYSGTGVGNGTFPGLYEHGQGGVNQRLHPYFQDSWKARDNLTINFGLAYDLETGLFYSNLPLPQYLAPILEGQTGGVPSGLGATQPNTRDFSPAFGFAWALGKDKKTVIRGGGGIYWDTQPIWQHFREGAAIGPPGDGRSTLAASAFTNTIPGILQLGCTSAPVCPVPVGSPIPLGALTTMTLGQFIGIVNQELPGIEAQLTPIPPASGPYSVTGIDLAKQGIEIYPSHFPLLRSYQTSIGVQRDLGHDMVLTVDWARRQGENTNLGEVDLNHFTRYINGVQKPVIPICAPAQYYVAGQECSTGAITFWTPEGRSVYDGLLVKVNKRFSHHFNFVASYALQKSLSEDASQDPLNFMAGYGPTAGLGRQNLNIAGTVTLPWGFSLAINSSMLSRGPQTAYIPGDILGTGDSNAAGTAISSLVPGLQFNCFGYSCGKGTLQKAVAQYNATYAGKQAPDGSTNPYAFVPSDYQFGDPTISQDFRLTKTFTVKERYKFSIFGEVFNAFNIANLQYSSFVLGTSSSPNTPPPPGTNTYGQPNNRTENIFGSGGPRAFQVGGRFSF